MNALSHADAFQVLLLQAADDGRGPVLFGDSVARAREAVPPFLIGKGFPDVYMEHPLAGDPFLDITLLLQDLEPGMRVDSPAAGEHGAMLDWFAEAWREHKNISWGFELDTKEDVLPCAAVHFQPRQCTQLVEPFFEHAGEPERARLYLDLAARMPEGWSLAFFGMFRGRPGSPLRVCGYLGGDEQARCADNPGHIAEVFDTVGFRAYDDAMLAQVAEMLAAAPVAADFQFDVFPDGSIGSIFAVDVQFGIEQPPVVWQSFTDGAGARVMGLLESWGAADERWKIAVRSAFARALPVDLDGGGVGRFAFTLMPQWVKARWADGVLQPSKLYHLAHAGLIGTGDGVE
jgi:hypothetical protein